jgi:hypothetical protein
VSDCTVGGKEGVFYREKNNIIVGKVAECVAKSVKSGALIS